MAPLHKQDKPLDTHKQLPSLEHEKCTIISSCSNDQRQEQEKQHEKPSKERKQREEEQNSDDQEEKRPDDDEDDLSVSVNEKHMHAGEVRERSASAESNGTVVGLGPRERLKRHRTQVAGHVWIPEMWGQEDLLKDWIDCSAFDKCLVNKDILSARASLVEEGRRSNSGRLRVENSC